jgi:hypothetical protein
MPSKRESKFRVDFNHADFARYVHGCVVRLRCPTTGPDEVIAKVLAGTDGRWTEVTTLEQGTFLIDPTSPDVRWNLSVPSKRMFNFNDAMYVFARTDARQWHRGLSRGTSSITRPTEGYYSRMGVASRITAVDNLLCAEAILEPKYPRSFDEALGSITNHKQMEVAVSQTFGISQSIDTSVRPLLWFYGRICGRLDLGSRAVMEAHPAIEQEIRDFLGRKAPGWVLQN